jgi:hypothetical protein
MVESFLFFIYLKGYQFAATQVPILTVVIHLSS